MARKTFRKQITSEDLTDKFNPDNTMMINRFIKDKNMKCSDETIKGYKSDLNIFFTWNLLHNKNKFFVDIKKIEFSDFFGYGIEELQWSPSRFGRMKSCLSSLSNFIVNFFDEDYPTYKNVILKAITSLNKASVREKTILLEDQVNDLLNYLSVGIKKPQEACLLALAACSGARASELLRFTTSIIDEDNTAFNDIFIETSKEIKTKGFGKQGKPLYKYVLRDIFLPYYREWLIEREKIMTKNNQTHDSIFIKSDGTPAILSTIRSWSDKWEKFLGVPFYFHSLRHYFVTQLTRLGMDSDFIVEVSGWSNAVMYHTYNDLTAKERKWKGLDKLKSALDKTEPVDVVDKVDNEEENLA